MAHTVKYTTEMVKAASNNCPLFKEAFEGFTDDQKYRAARATLVISELRAATEKLEFIDAIKKGGFQRLLQEIEKEIHEHLDAAVSLGLEKNHGMGIAKRLNTVVNVDSERYLFSADGKRIREG
nr:hypothetical protein [Candidatus Sigynarchaeota archaeon]